MIMTIYLLMLWRGTSTLWIEKFNKTRCSHSDSSPKDSTIERCAISYSRESQSNTLLGWSGFKGFRLFTFTNLPTETSQSITLPQEVLNLIAENASKNSDNIRNMARSDPDLSAATQYWQCSSCNDAVFIPREKKTKKKRSRRF